MKQEIFLYSILAFFSLMLTSCSSLYLDEASIRDKYKNKLIFFSNESNYMNEIEYYDALLELDDEYPADIPDLKTLTASDNTHDFESFHIKKTPAIYITSEKGVIGKISGSSVSKQDIKKTITKALESKN